MHNRTELSEPVKAIYPDLHLQENSSVCRQAVASWPPSITDIMAGLLVLYGTQSASLQNLCTWSLKKSSKWRIQ